MRLILALYVVYCLTATVGVVQGNNTAKHWLNQIKHLKRRLSDIKKKRSKHHVSNVKAKKFKQEEDKLKEMELTIVQSQLAILSDHIDWEKLQDEYWMSTFQRDNEQSSRNRRLAARKNRNRAKRHKQRIQEAAAKAAAMEAKSPAEADDFDAEALGNALDKQVDGVLGGLLSSSQPDVSGAHGGDDHDDDDKDEPPARPGDDHEDEGGIHFDEDGGLVFQVDPDDPNLATSSGAAASDLDISGRFDPSLGIPIPIYNYDLGNCPDVGDSPEQVPCAPDNLPQICDKYDENDLGKFSECFEACTPSFCCIHDAKNTAPNENFISPNCNTDVNCAQYACCYIVWWKLHDTIGQAQALRLEQTDDFFDVDADFIEGDVTNIEFFREMLFHHFDDAAEIIRLGTVQINSTLSEFDSDLIFLNETYWDTLI
uniref:Calmodulin n=1 Tax=Grammatophora oceanica TaxID=210454 RepID=A0A7S1VWT1_9STRA|mmetsp:Transcript_9136/g.13324  ORF Transcript_9136/g.13324 Transcript_9136/m.13324 type:complete len:427 (+) Transcript_9136:151-1431(+)|eukprot:CAMPEP_0194031060 /NCGR_PEP_ID=MMETSP0009_2-20130614/4331_1 /TAXON_ID=210454 /ORGANISM="Grammatophora oceanica, Strain CCMP 410" /LENGTH=426 /DNA_ID=CAMNT_0038671121 /DNA_START=150 /DNA_END=1430 /DNA_ORIENTATION=-